MKYRKLGNTPLELSELAYGAASLGDIYRTTDEKEGIASVHAAIDGGINYFDVAPLYGFTLAETRLGKALQGKRDQVLLATKTCRDRFDVFDFSAKRVRDSLDESLRRLKTDHIDVFQIHDVEFGDESQIVNETVPAALALKESGKVRFVGITGLPVRYLRQVASQVEIDTILSWGHCTLIENEMDEELTPLCQERGIGLMSASPLLQGLLTGTPPPEWHRSPEQVKAVIPKMVALCEEHDLSLATVALQYAMNYQHVATTVVGMSTVQRVERNIAAMQAEIPNELVTQLLDLAAPITNVMWFEGNPVNNIPPSDPNRWVPRSPVQSHS